MSSTRNIEILKYRNIGNKTKKCIVIKFSSFHFLDWGNWSTNGKCVGECGIGKQKYTRDCFDNKQQTDPNHCEYLGEKEKEENCDTKIECIGEYCCILMNRTKYILMAYLFNRYW